jgi:5-methylcytosine-specific restriction protein A
MPDLPPKYRPPHASRPRRDRRPSASQRGYGAEWRRLRDLILAERPGCEHPGCNKLATDLDHRISRERGGSDDPANLVPLCHEHHSEKTCRVDGGLGRPRA